MDIKEVLREVNGMDQYFTQVYDRNESLRYKTIYNNPNFIEWKEKALYALQQLNQDETVKDAILLLKRFKGWHDETDLLSVQTKINIILENFEQYTKAERRATMETKRLQKGIIITTAFSEFKLDQQIGQGGNGRVFSAEDISGEKFAIKFIPLNISEEKRKRLKNEIYYCEKENGPHIIRIFDHGVIELEEKYVYYIMPLYQKTLRLSIKEGISPDKVIDIFRGIVMGLQESHSAGIIHRDIKPENILIDNTDGKPVICDFGIAHFSEENLYTFIETKASERLANFLYAAPEQKSRGAEVGVQADLYAAALILNEMYTGEVPQSAEYKTIENANSNYGYLDQLFNDLYKQNPADRLKSASDVLNELDVLIENNDPVQRAKDLQIEIDSFSEPQKLELKLLHMRYCDGELHFVLNDDIPVEWFSTFLNKSFDRGYVIGYDKDRVRQSSENSLAIPLREGESENTILQIKKSMIEWIDTVNELYYEYLKDRIIKRKREIEEKQRIEQKRIEEADRINRIISKL